MYLHIGKLESGGQQLPVMKKNHPGNRFNLENPLFLLKVLKTYVFTQITECSIVTHFHHPELKSRAYIQPKTKENISAYPIQPEKIIFLSKNHKNTAFCPKVRNSQQVCI